RGRAVAICGGRAASGSGRADAHALRTRAIAPRRDAETHPDASVRLLARGDGAADLRLWISGRGGHAAPQLDVRAASDGDPVGSGDGLLQLPIQMKNRLRVLRAERDW